MSARLPATRGRRSWVVEWHPLGEPLPADGVLAQAPRVLCRSNHFQVLIERRDGAEAWSAQALSSHDGDA